MLGGKNAVLSFEELEADGRTGRMCGVSAERVVRGLQDDRRRRVDGGARDVCDAADTVRTCNRRDAFDQFGQRHRYAIDRHRQPGFERNFQTRGRVRLCPRYGCRRNIGGLLPERRASRVRCPLVRSMRGDDANRRVEQAGSGFNLRVILFVPAVRDDAGDFDPRNLDQLSGNESTDHTVTWRVRSRGLAERRGNAVVRKLVARIEHVCANRACGKRRLTNALKLAALSHIQCERYDVRIELRSETRNGGKVPGSARAGEDDDRLHAGCPSPVMRSNRFTSAFARRASGAMTSTVSSPATVPTTSGRCASSMLTQSACARPRPVRNSTSC